MDWAIENRAGRDLLRTQGMQVGAGLNRVRLIPCSIFNAYRLKCVRKHILTECANEHILTEPPRTSDTLIKKDYDSFLYRPLNR
ncbi:hypothetical protein TOTSKI_00030 [Facklamia hominis]